MLNQVTDRWGSHEGVETEGTRAAKKKEHSEFTNGNASKGYVSISARF